MLHGRHSGRQRFDLEPLGAGPERTAGRFPLSRPARNTPFPGGVRLPGEVTTAWSIIQQEAPFHGEFAVDPASGAVLRLTVQADLKPALPLARTDVMVEYGPVVIGETSYICPLRSVSISRPRTVMAIHEWGENFTVYAPFESVLSDMVYEKYHLFRPTARMLPGYTPAPKDK